MASKKQIKAEIKRLQALLPTMRPDGPVKEQCQGRIDALRWVLEQETK